MSDVSPAPSGAASVASAARSIEESVSLGSLEFPASGDANASHLRGAAADLSGFGAPGGVDGASEAANGAVVGASGAQLSHILDVGSPATLADVERDVRELGLVPAPRSATESRVSRPVPPTPPMPIERRAPRGARTLQHAYDRAAAVMQRIESRLRETEPR